ncbi:MAG: hypothetical protein J0M11_20115 [Anaerolineae bacterium]|nr:hypothetical protein [Anaerolineae bacterium]
MNRKLFVFIFSLVLTILLAQLPTFPYLSETREILEDGENLYQMWSFVSMPSYYENARFAQSGWLESTWNNYLILGVVNHVGLVLVFFLLRRVFIKFTNK